MSEVSMGKDALHPDRHAKDKSPVILESAPSSSRSNIADGDARLPGTATPIVLDKSGLHSAGMPFSTRVYSQLVNQLTLVKAPTVNHVFDSIFQNKSAARNTTNPGSTNIVSWASLFRPTISDRKAFSYVEILSNIKASVGDYIKFDDVELQEIRKPWFSSLIGRFFYKPPMHFDLRNWAFSVWSMFNIQNVIDLENGFFLFRFSSEKDAIKVLSEGPWFQGNLINLRPWKSNFKAMTETIDSAPIWVQFPDLPMKYWSDTILFKIASLIGKPIKIDEQSFNWERGRFDQTQEVSDRDKGFGVDNDYFEETLTEVPPSDKFNQLSIHTNHSRDGKNSKDLGVIPGIFSKDCSSVPVNDNVQSYLSNISASFNSLVDKVTPSLVKFNVSPSSSSLETKNKNKGKGIRMASGFSKASKIELNKNLANLDDIMPNKKKRSRKDNVHLDGVIPVMNYALDSLATINDKAFAGSVDINPNLGIDFVYDVQDKS
ncbi:hypothetical protein Cni_G19929 [Canna indica]|uniref:DUF4283 domain-containing protein n=1 Tax=Canna indica TaxID=4628 RepID=A0AAQ3KQF2_9LILI|nr:hypothetical protein Cni_G19929 [Canna indica]